MNFDTDIVEAYSDFLDQVFGELIQYNEGTIAPHTNETTQNPHLHSAVPRRMENRMAAAMATAMMPMLMRTPKARTMTKSRGKGTMKKTTPMPMVNLKGTWLGGILIANSPCQILQHPNRVMLYPPWYPT